MLKRVAPAALALFAAAPVLAQTTLRGEATATVAGKVVSIEYGRPSLRGRDMLGQAQIGQAWRMGADSATTLKTEADLLFGGATVPAGEYVLTATKIAADRWQLNVLARADRAKVAEIPLSLGSLSQSVEVFSIALTAAAEKGEFEMRWGTTALKASFTAR